MGLGEVFGGRGDCGWRGGARVGVGLGMGLESIGWWRLGICVGESRRWSLGLSQCSPFDALVHLFGRSCMMPFFFFLNFHFFIFSLS